MLFLAIIFLILSGIVAYRWNDDLKGWHAVLLSSLLFGVIRTTIEGFFDPTATDMEFLHVLTICFFSYLGYAFLLGIALLGNLNLYNSYVAKSPADRFYWRHSRPEALDHLRILNRYRD